MAAYTEEVREQALVRLMEQYGDSIKRMCCVYLRDLGAAEDASQETFIKAYSHIDGLLCGEIENERAWLSRIAINTCKDYLRSAWKRRVNLMEQLPEVPAQETMPRDEAEELYQAVQALKPKYREVILLHYYQGLRVGEIAAILRAPQSTVSIRLRRARQMLNRMLGGSDQSEDYPREDP